METFSNVNLALSEYESLKTQISELKAENEKLKAEKEQLCEQNKVRIVRKACLISRPVPFWNPDMLSQVETTTDELVNFEDVEELVKAEIKDKLEADLKKANEKLDKLTQDLESANERYKLIVDIHDAVWSANQKLRNRNLWQRIINKD